MLYQFNQRVRSISPFGIVH